jgi:hypothetical protein
MGKEQRESRINDNETYDDNDGDDGRKERDREWKYLQIVAAYLYLISNRCVA